MILQIINNNNPIKNPSNADTTIGVAKIEIISIKILERILIGLDY